MNEIDTSLVSDYIQRRHVEQISHSHHLTSYRKISVTPTPIPFRLPLYLSYSAPLHPSKTSSMVAWVSCLLTHLPFLPQLTPQPVTPPQVLLLRSPTIYLWVNPMEGFHSSSCLPSHTDDCSLKAGMIIMI